MDPRALAVEKAVVLRAELLEAQVNDELVTAKTEHELRRAVSNALYEHFHTGLSATSRPVRAPEPELERRYASRLPHRYSRAHGTAAQQPACDSTVFGLEGVRVEFPPESVLAIDGDRYVLSVGCQRPHLSPGFYTVVGSRGWTPRAPILRVYVNVGTAEMAVEAWGRALKYLEASEATYQAKVISRASLVSRRDGMVVYLDGAARPLVAGLVREVSQLALCTEVPTFTRAMAAGISYAWEPVHHSPQGRLSFGQHRARAITAALFDQAANPEKPFMEHVRERLIEYHIEPTEIHRNIDSPALEEVITPT
ncbi:hypothetical protein BKI49_09965 [Streptomyces sp. Tue6028]|nr:hypothetical protein BKI49_09965 [Streptomyces sp. Tue6028]